VLPLKEILVFGAGRVAKPCVDYLLKDQGKHVTVVDMDPANVERVTAGRSNATGLVRNAVADARSIIDEVKPHVVINLLPAAFMARVAELCIEAGVPCVNPSYIKQDMKALDEKARDAGVLLLCELGLDPGIDHMSAARTIRSIHDKGGSLESFWSCCGALPSLKDNTNPFGYKLSWAPAGLIGASKREARIMKDGEVVVHPEGETFRFPSLVEIEGLGWFEEYANADSLPYVDLYGMPEVRDCYRGTLRFLGWSETIRKMLDMGLFDQDEMNLSGLTFAALTRRLIGASAGEDLEKALASFLKLEPYAAVLMRLRWLGLLSEEPIPMEKGSARDVVSHLYFKKLVFADQEQDLVVMEHRYVAQMPGRENKTFFKSTLIDYGVAGGETSIARTTGIPPAIGASLILDGKIALSGVQAPVLPEIYEPALELLEAEGIFFRETVQEL
jgi:saccharopine dehydrogenase-like NADP-dependent oxidoreductase